MLHQSPCQAAWFRWSRLSFEQSRLCLCHLRLLLAWHRSPRPWLAAGPGQFRSRWHLRRRQSAQRFGSGSYHARARMTRVQETEVWYPDPPSRAPSAGDRGLTNRRLLRAQSRCRRALAHRFDLKCHTRQGSRNSPQRCWSRRRQHQLQSTRHGCRQPPQGGSHSRSRCSPHSLGNHQDLGRPLATWCPLLRRPLRHGWQELRVGIRP